ncbi:MAG TPA: ABC transporter permease [Candidatus Dormibacteraeota bacterium]
MASPAIVVTRAANPPLSWEMRDLLQHRDLLLLLVRKDLRVKYKGTALGFLWSLLNPLLMMLVYAVVYSLLFRFQVPRYPIFLLAGLLPWNAFLASVSGSAMAIVLNGQLIRRVRFPLELLPLTTVLAALVNLVFSLAILFIFAGIYRQPLGLPLLALPLLLVLQGLLALGIALMVSAITVYFRDLEYLIGVGLTALFFATPIIYPLSALGKHHNIQFWLRLNPLTWLAQSYQSIWHENRWPDGGQLLELAVLGIVWTALGWLLFRRLRRRFAEEV